MKNTKHLINFIELYLELVTITRLAMTYIVAPAVGYTTNHKKYYQTFF